jgi:DNA polymerase III psi subunit
VQNHPQHSESALFADIKRMIDSSRHKVLVAVNTKIALLYWNIGKYINHFLLSNGRAEYGKQIVAEFSPRLVEEYGKGWGKEHLWHCIRSSETFTEDRILYAVRRQLNWTQIRTIQYLKDGLQQRLQTLSCVR